MSHVLVCRPPAQSAQLAQTLADAGYTPEPFAVLDTVPDRDALAALPRQAAAADELVFVSPSAVDAAWPALAGAGLGARLVCVGRESARRLAALSGRAVLCPDDGHDSEALLALPELAHVAGRHVLIVRGDGGRATLGEALAARGARVAYAEVYRRVPLTPDWARFDALAAAGRIAAVVVTSGDIARALFDGAGPGRRAALATQRFVTLHPRIAALLADYGVSDCAVSAAASDAALVAAITPRP